MLFGRKKFITKSKLIVQVHFLFLYSIRQVHGIHGFYNKDYLGESFSEKEVKEALKMKLREPAFQDLANDFDRLKWKFIQEFKNSKRFQFYELPEVTS